MPRLAAQLSVLLAIVAAACGGGDALRVEEYTEFCADSIAATRSIADPELVSWAELGEIAERSLARLDGVAPPAELGSFHRAVHRTLEFVGEVAAEQPADDAVNPLAFGFNAVRIATQLSRAVDDLPADVRAQLEAAGCL